MNKEQATRHEAYAIWESEGRPAGKSEQHWRQAEERLAARLKAQKPTFDDDARTHPGGPAQANGAGEQAGHVNAAEPAAKAKAAKAEKPRAARRKKIT